MHEGYFENEIGKEEIPEVVCCDDLGSSFPKDSCLGMSKEQETGLLGGDHIITSKQPDNFDQRLHV